MKRSLLVLAGVALIVSNGHARPSITLEPDAADGYPGLVVVETAHYRIAFDRAKQGGAQTAWFKPWALDLRAEDYYGTHMPLFHPFVTLADPDPLTGFTRHGHGEAERASLVFATHEVVRHTDDELVIEFRWNHPKGKGPDWMRGLIHRKRLTFRDDSPAIGMEYEVENTDGVEHAVLVNFWNSASQGRVNVKTSILADDGMRHGTDTAAEGSSSDVLVPKLGGSFIGGVSEGGTGVGYSYDWRDVDAMKVGNFKTVGSTYHVLMRRRAIPAGGRLVTACTFMPFRGLPSLDGMADDLAGGLTIAAETGASSSAAVTLVSGAPRTVTLTLRCSRMEDGKVVLEEEQPLQLETATARTVATHIPVDGEGLYVLSVVADDGAGTVLRMERGIEIGRSRQRWMPTPPPGEKRGTADASETLYPPRLHAQFRTLDRTLATPHLPLLANHAQGSIRAFFLTHANATLSHVREVAQRGDFEFDYAAVETIGNPRGALHALALREFDAAWRAYDPAVLVLLGIDAENGLGDLYLREILQRVEQGMGLVLQTPPPEPNSRLARAMAAWDEVNDVPVSCIATPMSGVAARARHFTFGQGRIVLYPVPQRLYRDEGELLLTDWTTLGTTGIAEDGWRGFEYAYAHFTDRIRWAAGLESPVRVIEAAVAGHAVTVRVENRGPARETALALTLRTRDWESFATAGGRVRLPAGVSAHDLALDRSPPGGANALEISVRDADGRALAFGSQAIDGGPAAIAITCNPPARDRMDPGQIMVTVSNHTAAGVLEVRFVDRFGRVVQAESIAVPTAQDFTAPVFIEASRVVDYYHEIRADFIPGGGEQPTARGSGRVALMPERMPYEYRFVGGVAGAPERKIKHIQGMLAACRQGNLEMHTHAVDFGQMYRSGGYSCGYAFTGAKHYTLDDRHVMHPPLAQSEETLAARKADWQRGARRYFENGTRAMLLDDERRFSGEWDYSVETLTAFREHLRVRYQSIEGLNRSWGTDFATFDVVMPVPLATLMAGDGENRASWLEHRMFCGELLAQNHIKGPHDWAREIDPRLSVGELGIYSASALYPVDWAVHAKYYQHTQRYDMGDEFRSFAPGVNHGIWAGYGWITAQPEQRLAPWRSLLDGGHWIWFWEMRSDGRLWYAVVTSDLRLTEPYRMVCDEEFPDIQGGLDQMIIASVDQDQDVAVAYSYPSLMLGGDKGRRSPGIAGESCALLRALGAPYRFVDLKGEAMDRLSEAPYQLLIAQHLACVGAEEAEKMEAFARAGRPVLVVGRMGWLDTVGSPHADGALGDWLCGIDTGGSAFIGKPANAEFRGMSLHLLVERSGVSVTDAEVLVEGMIDGVPVPVLTRRRVGAGSVYWLNGTLAGESQVVSGGVAGEETVIVAGPAEIRASHMALYRELLQVAGVVPAVRLTQDGEALESGEVWTYASPSGRSRTVAFCPNTGTDKLRAQVAFRDGPRHVYDLRTQAYHGNTHEIVEVFPPCRMMAYALLPYRVTGLALKASPDAVAAGDAIMLDITVNADQGSADLHGIRLTVTDPQGHPVEAYRTVLLARDGRVQHRLPTALNPALGAYRVTATDCVSGATAEVTVTVR